MSDLRTEAMKMALEALEVGDSAQRAEAVIALSDALAQPEQEPVAWMDRDSGVVGRLHQWKNAIPLYTAPSKRDWQGLTDEEFEEAVDGLEDLRDCWIQIEAKLKEKNT